ncbi:MAG: DUF1800 domain-containing protein [Gammaproteobacteria bacterium]|nr:DUF1800 domain-containing protein [Gammaproteobacteria bacterium]MCP5199878.1 DUF1800 domain-containing protein [Gammaproteobacteria bacterium]
MRTLLGALLAALLLNGTTARAATPAERLAPIAPQAWDRAAAAHLLERAGFGGTPREVDRLAALGPDAAVRYLVNFDGAPPAALPPFEHSGIFDPGLDPFPPSRPATTKLAADTGEALGIKVRSGGNRPMQPIVNAFFYWLRASMLETDRVAQWWAERMLVSPRPLEEKMALFWHGHFATNEEKVRDYRKMLGQLELFQRAGLGSFRTLLIGVAQDPAMLAYLDAGVNVKGSPNENFAREIMELFTMGVGNYTEHDIREAARAFTGWNFVGTTFHVDPARHDDGPKTFFGETGNFDGVDIIDRILAHPATPAFIAGKLYRFFVRDELDADLQAELGRRLAAMDYEISPFLAMLFSSREFYSEAARGTRIKSPVEYVVSTYRKLGLDDLPGAPDFNVVTAALGQRLMHPPTVAGWSYGRSWITPSLLIERGNFALDLVFPDIEFVPADRYPVYPTGEEIRAVHRRLRAGADMVSATRPVDVDTGGGEDMMAMSNQVDREEAFNTRYGSYRGWQMAIERVKPIERDLARLDLAHMVLGQELATPLAVVDYFTARFFSVPLDDTTRHQLAAAFEQALGSADVLANATTLEEPLRVLLHLMLSRPEYQLG